ncbi:Transcription factor Pcc1 [Candidatus Gugararchaeum adminiculabundum]|nr:Transcription factor Pcc1 [Candidatus Gugararchaeum adminiculabundum]
MAKTTKTKSKTNANKKLTGKRPRSRARPQQLCPAPRFTSSMRITFKNSKLAQNAKDSLLQETEFKKRCRASVASKGNTLEISLEADDLPVLRAALNSYIRLLYIFEGIESVEETADE